VEVTANFDVNTGIVRWVFTSLDPQTLDVPDDPLAGFLPPNRHPHDGEGFVSYTVEPLSNLVTSTVIHAQATVIFDDNKPIDTPRLHNTIDALPPMSTVSPLPPHTPPSFLVTWSGTDDQGGSGVAFFDVFVSDNDGPFLPWSMETTRTRAVFTGVFGHSYTFYSVAIDNAGNREAAPSAPEATTVADLPATATHFRLVLPANPVAAGMPFTVTIIALDNANHVVSGYTGTVHFTSRDALALLPGDYTFTADDNGVHVFTVTLGTAGNQTLTVTDTQNGALTGQAATITEFPIPTAHSGPNGIVLGPDGNLWFVETTANQIGRMKPDGTINEFAIPTANSSPTAIAVGPDGNLWFTESGGNRIGRITPDGVITEFLIPTANSGPLGITQGPDGNLWFTEWGGNRIGRITPDGAITEFALPTAGSAPWGITAGPDGSLWFTEFNANQIGRITPDGATITEFSLSNANSGPESITIGPDGNLWFTEANANQIGRITPDGATITEFPIATLDSGPAAITLGPDGNLWFTETNGNQIAQITPGGTITEFLIPTDGGLPVGITVGPDGNFWFTESQGGIGQLLVGVTVTPPPSPPRPPTRTTSFLEITRGDQIFAAINREERQSTLSRPRDCGLSTVQALWAELLDSVFANFGGSFLDDAHRERGVSRTTSRQTSG
jgi:streptogramin lyase